MSNHRLTLTFQGLASEGGKVRLGDFINTLQCLSAITNEADMETSEGGSKTFYLRVIDISFSSPYKITVEPWSTGADHLCSLCTAENAELNGNPWV